MPTLYEINETIQAVQDQIEEAGGVVDDSARANLEVLRGETEERAEWFAKIIKNLEAEKAAFQEERDRFNRKIKSADNSIKFWKSQLINEMIGSGHRKIHGKLFKISLSSGVFKVEAITDPEEVSEDYKRIVETVEFDKKKMIYDYKAGKTISGAVIVEGNRLSIR
jgi:hypothetical protein